MWLLLCKPVLCVLLRASKVPGLGEPWVKKSQSRNMLSECCWQFVVPYCAYALKMSFICPGMNVCVLQWFPFVFSSFVLFRVSLSVFHVSAFFPSRLFGFVSLGRPTLRCTNPHSSTVFGAKVTFLMGSLLSALMTCPRSLVFQYL